MNPRKFLVRNEEVNAAVAHRWHITVLYNKITLLLKSTDTEVVVTPAKSTKAQQSRQTILNAASSLFLEKGVGGLSARAIAARAGVSTMGIYSHFNGKQGILDALYIEGFEYVSKTMDVPGNLTGVDRLLHAGDQYLAMGDAHEAHYRLIFGEADNGYQPSAEAVRVRVAAFKKLVGVSGALLADKVLIDSTQQTNDNHQAVVAKEECLQFALEVWALLHGFVSLKHHTLGTVDFELGDALTGSWNWKQAARSALLRLASSYDFS